MATKTYLITTLPASSVSPMNYSEYEAAGRLPVSIKRPFSVAAAATSSTPISLNFGGTSNSILTGKSTTLTTASGRSENDGPLWLPATVQRAYKYEPIDEFDYSDETEDAQEYAELGDQPPRKRERLTHLTPEEKMFRRKMKNRIAAQTARDRKKAMMVDLEETVRRLEEENDALLRENSKLRDEQCNIAEENDRLKQLLAEQKKAQTADSTTSSTTKSAETIGRRCQDDAHPVSTVGPAESINVPLPKEQAKTGWALTWLVASALIQLYSTYCAKLSPEEEAKMRFKLEELKENDSFTMEDVLKDSPPDAVEKLRSIIRLAKSIPTKPP